MSFPARENRITFGAVVAWLLVIVLAVVVLFLIFRSDRSSQTADDWSTEGYGTPGWDHLKHPIAIISEMDWLLTDLKVDGRSHPVSEAVATTFRCETDGRYGGSGGCNRYFGHLEFDEQTHTLTMGAVGSTMMACPPPKSDQERAYLGGLEKVTRVEMGNHRLRLSSADDSTVLIFSLVFPDESGAPVGVSGEVGAGGEVGAAEGAGAAGVGATVGGKASGGGEPESPPKPLDGNIDVDTQSAPGGKAARASIIYRGTLKLEGQALMFTPCGTELSVRVDDPRFNLDVVGKQEGLNLDEGIYAEFRAGLQPHESEGARLRLTDPLFLANEGGSCEHLSPVATLVASGNEPFWTLIVDKTHTTLRTPDGEWRLEGGMHPDDAYFSMPTGTRSMTLKSTELTLQIVVEKRPCHDTMVDAWSSYVVHVEYEKKSESGCGRPGRWLPPLMGRYGAELPAASSPGRSLRLLLFDGGVAQLSQDYQNGEAAVRQLGLWQQRDASTAVIHFLAQGDKPVYEHMVFTGDGNTLTAVEFDHERWGNEGLRLGRIADQGK